MLKPEEDGHGSWVEVETVWFMVPVAPLASHELDITFV